MAALNEEWVALDAGSAPTVASWAERHPVLVTCCGLNDVLDAVAEAPDLALAALLRESAAGDRLATRCVVQALLGKLVRMARRSRSGGIDDFLAALWCRVVVYPLDRRPSRIAANLVLDTLKDVTRLERYRELEELVAWPPAEQLEVRWVGAEESGPSAAALIRAAVDLRVITADHAAVLQSVYLEGLPSEQAALRHQTSPDLIRYRCSTATRRMRQGLAPLLAAA